MSAINYTELLLYSGCNYLISVAKNIVIRSPNRKVEFRGGIFGAMPTVSLKQENTEVT